MTTTYKNTEFTSAESLREAINTELTQLAYPFAIKHKTYGEGWLTCAKVPLAGPSLFITVDFAEGTKTFSLDTIFSSNLLEMPEILVDILLEAQTIYKTDFIERENERRIANTLAREQVREAEKKAEADKKAKEKFEKLKENTIKNFEEFSNREKTPSDTDDFYYALGWLAKHVGSISARIPDYLKNAFIKNFGTEAGCHVVDTSKRTSNGNAMQWTFSFTVTLRKADEVPTILTQYLSSTGKAIANTAFIWDLVENYGFQFGKKQDIEKIKNAIPSQHIISFEEGLA